MRRGQRLMQSVLLGLILISCFWPTQDSAMTPLSDGTINQAIKYGIENQGWGLSVFLGSNWREGADGSLLNIYTPFMTLARTVAKHHFKDGASPESVAAARKVVRRDLDYIWEHPAVKFMVSLYGDNESFAKDYFAVIEGVGEGRSFTIYPSTRIPQTLATKDSDTTYKPYTAVNAYYFNVNDIAPLDEYVFKLYGKGLEPIVFKVYNRDIQ
jgi:hypothetical protein